MIIVKNTPGSCYNNENVLKSTDVPCEIAVCITLLYLATNSFQSVIGKLFHINESAVGKIVKKILLLLDKNVSNFVKFPTCENEQNIIASNFYSIDKFPKVAGLLDCTHVAVKPPKSQELAYVNRKGKHTINVQVVCDDKLKIRHYSASWPGSTHDSFVLRQSEVWDACEGGILDDRYILADSGYPNRKWLLSVYLNPLTEAEKKFNVFLRKTRVYVECTFGQWKKEFSILNFIRLKIDMAPIVISVCAMLRNIRINRNLTHPMRLLHLIDPDLVAGDDENLDASLEDKEGRDFVVRKYFS